MTELEQFRAQKDTFFKTHPQRPLLPDQQNMFEGLRYFFAQASGYTRTRNAEQAQVEQVAQRGAAERARLCSMLSLAVIICWSSWTAVTGKQSPDAARCLLPSS